MNKSFYDLLQLEWHDRLAKHRNYSLRRYARDLGVSVSLLSQLMRAQRIAGKNTAEKILTRLEINGEARTIYLTSLAKTRKQGLRMLGDAKTYKDFPANNPVADEVVSKWYHFAILNLASTVDFNSEPAWIAKRLGISVAEVGSALRSLEKLGIISHNGGKIVVHHENLETTRDVPSAAIRKYHESAIERSLHALHKVPLGSRDITSLMIPFDPAKLPDAKSLISDFVSKMDNLLGNEKGKEVYALNVQLVPVTLLNNTEA